MSAAASRRQCRAAFFGRTSAGKSTAINALIGSRLLPSGLGSTTSCFVEAEAKVSVKEPRLIVRVPNDEDQDEDAKSVELDIG